MTAVRSPLLVDLLLDNGSIVRVEIPQAYTDEVLEDITNALKNREWWSVHRYEGTTAAIDGTQVDRVAMSRVVAML